MSKRIRDRSHDAVCDCDAYPFPHRQFGGKCDAREWVAELYFSGDKECVECINNVDHECQVSTGTEETFHCPALREHLRYEGIKLYGKALQSFNRSTRGA